jgi:hypothetical protein
MAIEKITREQVISYLNTTPSTTATWGLIGIGITSYGLAFNPQVTTEKWIINQNATSSVDSYQIQGEVSQKCYKGDPIFEFVNELRRTAGVGSNAETEILDIDTYDETTANNYKATKYACTIAVTNYMSEEAVIEYSIYYNGDPVIGTVRLDTDGKPTFTKEGSI